MSVIDSLEDAYITFLCAGELLREVTELILSLMLELNTLKTFDLSYCDDFKPLVDWEGKYTSGSIGRESTTIRFCDCTINHELNLRVIFPSIILSIQHNSMLACSPSLWNKKPLHPFINHGGVAWYIENHCDDKDLVIIEDIVLDGNRVDVVVRELLMVWEMCTKKGLTYRNDLLCVRGISVPMIPKQSASISFFITSDNVAWKGESVEGFIKADNILISYEADNRHAAIKGTLPALILAIQYHSTNGCELNYHAKDGFSSHHAPYTSKKAISHLYHIFGCTDDDTKKMATNLEELKLVWETCKKKGLRYKDNVLCRKGVD
jgi:hypothetical protein